MGGGGSRGERFARKRSKSRSTQGDFRIALTLDQKVAVIVSEHDHMKNEENRREATNEKKLDQLEVRRRSCFSSSDNNILPLSLVVVRSGMDGRRDGRFRLGHH